MLDPHELPLPRGQTAVLALLQRWATREGYSWFLVATTPEEKVLTTVEKLDGKFLVNLPPLSRHYRRQAGLPVAHLLLGPGPQGGRWPYALLADKKLPGEAMKRLSPESPLRWLAYREGAWQPTYELVPDERGGWTWRLVAEFHRALLEEALHHARRGDWPRLVGHLRTLGNLPAYRGVWGQLQDIRKRVQRLWGDTQLRSPDGQWKAPPWRAALEGWPKTPLSPVGMRLWVEAGEGRPRSLGEWLEGPCG
ncbi:hypothetical protein [Thermus sp.]|uniref:hypothetical protein n=1 Tax=Thermus sp. TaxID=275 RepID=UPI0025EB9448|nr:hypothetical protein [Thermus sp.]